MCAIKWKEGTGEGKKIEKIKTHKMGQKDKRGRRKRTSYRDGIAIITAMKKSLVVANKIITSLTRATARFSGRFSESYSHYHLNKITKLESR